MDPGRGQGYPLSVLADPVDPADPVWPADAERAERRGGARGILRMSIGEVASATLDAARAMLEEAPEAETLPDLALVFLGPGRRAYSGILLAVLAALALLLGA